MNRIFIIVCVFFCCISTSVIAWDGYDYQRNSYIEIESGNTVRKGNDIEVYDYNSGEYKTYEVDNIHGNEVEVYDYDTGEYRTFDMDE